MTRKQMMRVVPGLFMVTLVFLLALLGGNALTWGPHELVEMGRCELPQDVTVDGGWDIDPALGNWGGLDESLFAVAWEPGSPDLPALAGREAVCTISGVQGHKAKFIKIKTLNGIANDDYCVFVDVWGTDVRIGCYDETSPTEKWITTTFPVPKKFMTKGQDFTIKVMATGNSWSGFNTWGQLGVDYIEVWGRLANDDDSSD